MKRGIYLVANRKSQEMCENLIYSIRGSGCLLPIRLIHFGGAEVTNTYILKEVELLRFENFTEEAKEFVKNLRSVLTDCPLGYLYRFLAWFSDWDEFIYSDNDVVALCNWEVMFSYLDDYDLVHADEEYTTNGIYNYDEPEQIKKMFGLTALESAITAGHMVVKRDNKMITDFISSIEWFKQNTHIPKKHDQSLLHIASLLGKWRVLNLCKPPYNWLSSWAGDYKNSLNIIQLIQTNRFIISHIHYSGGTPQGNLAIQDLLFSARNDDERLAKLSFISLKSFSKYNLIKDKFARFRKRIF